MIKKILSLGIVLLSFVSVSFGEWIFHDVNEEFTVPNASSFTLKVLSSSAGILNGGGMSKVKPLIVLQSNRSSTEQYRYIYFWGTDKKLYAYGNSAGSQSSPSGLEYLKFDKFYRFSNTNFTNCTYQTLHNCSYSEEVNAESFYNDTSLKSAMTRFAYFYLNDNNNYTAFCWVYDNLGFSICVKPSGASTTDLTPVAGLSLDPVEFSETLIGTSPRTSNVPDNNGGGVSSNVGITGTLTGNLVYGECTNQAGIDYYENVWGFSSVMCYGGLFTYDTYTGQYVAMPGMGLDVFNMYNHANQNSGYSNFKEWYNEYYNIYRSDSLWMKNNLPTIYYTYFKINENRGLLGWGSEDVFNYCSLLIRSNRQGSLKDNPYIPQEDLNYICGQVVESNNQQNYNVGSGVAVSVDWNGVGNLGSGTGSTTVGSGKVIGGTAFISDYFNKIKSSFHLNDVNNGTTGILPTYIVMVLMALIIFRFLSH